MSTPSAQFDRTVSEHGVLMRRVALAAVITATGLVALKALAFILTDSMAMMASLADSSLDVFASFVNLLAVRHALTPADREHRFGHGKAEPLAGLAQSAFIAGSSAFLVIESINRMITPRPIEHSTVGLAVMGISIVATVVLVTVQQMRAGPPPPPSEQTPLINWSVKWGLVAVGACLLVGLFSEAAALGAVAFLAMFYFAAPPWPGLPVAAGDGHYLIVNRNLIELFAALALATVPTGRWAGLDFWIHRFRQAEAPVPPCPVRVGQTVSSALS